MKLFNFAFLLAVFLLINNTFFGQAPSLGSASDFALFSTVGALSNTGNSKIAGNIGTNSGAITGFGNVNGTVNNGNGLSALCSSDLLLAYNQLDTTTPTFYPSPALGNGDTLIDGVYYISSAATLNTHLILNAQGNPNAVFIFQIQGTFSTNASSAVLLINAAQACNVFWKVEGLVDMATGTTMRGTIIVNNAAINMASGDTLEGRALTTNGAITVDGVILHRPIGCGIPVLTGPTAPTLGSTACYALFSSVGAVANSGATHATGDIGTNSGLTTGYTPSFVSGAVHPTPDGSTGTCASDLSNLYSYLDTLTYDIELLSPSLFGSNLLLTPHTYYLNSATILTDTLYLDAQGNSNAIFVIRINGAFSSASYSKVVLANGTQAKNVFWNINGAVTIGDNSIFNGTIASSGAILINTGATINGRALTSSGALTTSAITVNANTIPDIGSIVSPAGICIGSIFALSDSITGGTWSLSNTLATIGSSSGIVTGITAGIDTIIYTITNVCGSSSTTTTISINPLVTSAPTNNGPICSGNSVTLNANPGGVADTYIWSGANLSSPTIQNPIATPTVTTVYSLTVTNSSGYPGCNPVTVYTTTVIVNPEALAQPSNSGPICKGGSVTLYANLSAGVTSFTWAGPGLPTTTLPNPSFSPTVTGTYSLTISSSLGSGYSPISVYTTLVIVWPIPVLAPYNNGPICRGGSSTLSGNPSGGALTYLWSGPNLASNTNQNPIATPSVTATYSVTTTNSTGASGCSPATVYTMVVTVNPKPIASPTNSGAICNTGTVTLMANPGSGATLYSWTGAGIYPTNIENPIVSPSVTTTYSLTVSSGTGSGCSPATVYTTIVVVNPIPYALPTNGGPICTGGTVNLYANPSGGASVYSWSGPGLSASTLQNPTATPTVTTVYSLTVTNGSGLSGCSPSIFYTTTVTVNENPSGISGSTIACTGSSTSLSSSYGGVWSSNTITVATINSTSGRVVGIGAGTSVISYMLGSRCFTTQVITINPLPSTVSVTGGGITCNVDTLTASGSGGIIYFQGTTSSGTSTTYPSISEFVSISGTYYFRAQSSAGCWGEEGSTIVSMPK